MARTITPCARCGKRHGWRREWRNARMVGEWRDSPLCGICVRSFREAWNKIHGRHIVDDVPCECRS